MSADGMAARKRRRYFMQAGLSEKGKENQEMGICFSFMQEYVTYDEMELHFSQT
jgi:hypothetical protein